MLEWKSNRLRLRIRILSPLVEDYTGYICKAQVFGGTDDPYVSEHYIIGDGELTPNSSGCYYARTDVFPQRKRV